jgi:glutamine cyclotransferase
MAAKRTASLLRLPPLLLLLCGARAQTPRLYSYKVIESHHHDARAFTQGLTCSAKPDCTTFYESTGIYGETSVREVERTTGKVVRMQDKISSEHFGEGLVRWGDEFYLLTWRTNLVLVYDAESWELKRKVRSPMKDGWGLAIGGTADRPEMLGTDSSATLYFFKPSADGTKLVETRPQLTIHDGSRSVKWVNEIEVIKGELWGMIWQTECIARIDPKDGSVLGWILMDGLTMRARRAAHTRMDVLNGIAYNADTDQIWVTGKLWPELYEVEIAEVPSQAIDRERLHSARQRCIK